MESENKLKALIGNVSAQKENWKYMDASGDGVCSKLELFSYIKSHFPAFQSVELLNCAWVATSDTAAENIPISMFSLFLTSLLACGEAMLVFAKLTGDSGSVQKLTYAEFKVAAAMSRMSVKDDVLRPIFDDMDSDKGGKISLQEFCVWYSRMKDNMDAGQTPQPQPRAALSASKPRITSRRPLSTSGSSAFSSAARRPPSSAAAQVSDTNPAFQRVTAEKKKSPFEVNLVKAFDAAQARKTAGSLREVKVPAGGALSAIKSINTARMMESPRDEPTPSIVTLSKQQLLAALPAEAVAAMQRSSISPEHDSLREPAKFGAALVDWLEKRWAEVQAHKETLQAAWKTLDENGNGLISGAEVDTWIVKRFPKMHVKPAVRQAFLMCRGEDGFIHRPKFGQLLNSIILCCRAWIMFDELNLADAVKQAAYKADPDARAYKDSRIQLEEFRVCFQKLFPAAMTGQCEAEWALMDADGKGMVLFGEFCVWYAAKAASGFRLAEITAKNETPKKQGTHQHEKQDVSYEDDEDFLEAIEVSELPKELSPRSNVLVGVRTVLQGVVANAASRSPSSSPVHGSRPSSAVVSGTSGDAATSGKAKDVDCELSPRSSVLVGVRTVLQGVVANAASRSPSSSPISSRPSSAVVIGEDKSRNRS
jgi:Ca2+-binding EF-hand superfamily protein